MSTTGDDDTTVCGGAGENLGEINIKIWDHRILNVAIRFKAVNMLADGHPEHEVKGIRKDIEAFYEKLYDKLRRLGYEAYEYEPHAENFEP